MRKDIIVFGVAVALLVIISSGFRAFDSATIKNFHISENEIFKYHVPSKEESLKMNVVAPYVGKTFTGFKQALAAKESAGLYGLVNAYGYMGKYQFGRKTLRNVGVHDFKHFLNNPEIQEKAFDALLSINKWVLRKEIKKYAGKTIKGVEITESGLLAAAHLGGAGSVKAFLRSNGNNGFRDGFGTSIKTYLRRFKGFDTTVIEPNRFAKI